VHDRDFCPARKAWPLDDHESTDISSGDDDEHHASHTDAWYAETQTQFGRNVVVGNLVYSLVLGMSVPM